MIADPDMRMPSNTLEESVRLIAFYLPQFHPIPENDEVWGKGFTEWTSVTRATPQFPGHYQPHLPADLGFYDLRVPETRQVQADLARQHGIHGFCYYHFWFNGRRLLERPFQEVLDSGRPDFPFCLCWANENWTRAWNGGEKEVFVRQTYGDESDRNHIRWLIEVFQDPRYIRVEGRPLFLIYRASQIPDVGRMIALWRQECRQAGIGEIYLCRVDSFKQERGDPITVGFDAAVEFQPDVANLGKQLRRTKFHAWLCKFRLQSWGYFTHQVFDYEEFLQRMLDKPLPPYPYFRCAAPSWDNTPRRRVDGLMLHGATPALYERWLRGLIQQAHEQPPEKRLVFINAWNEWAEGTHLEPDQRWGLGNLQATARALRNSGAPVRAAAPVGTDSASA